MVEIIKKINYIINENSLIISVGTFRELMSKKQNEFVLRYSTYIYDVWKIFYDQFDEFTYPVDSISHLYQAIVKIESKDKENNYLIFGNVDSINLQIGYLKSYFEKLEKKINTLEYSDVKEQGLYFLKPVQEMMEILDIIWKENEKYYNNVDRVRYSDVKEVTGFLNKMKKAILNEENNEEIIRGREIFKRFVRKIEKDFKNYSEVDKEKLSELLYQFYKELSNKIEISQREEFEWNSIGIELFRLKKYKKYWEPGMNIIQVP